MARRSQNFEGAPSGAAFTLANSAGGGYPVVTYRSNANSDTVATTAGVGQGSVAALATAQSGVITAVSMVPFGVKAEGVAALIWIDPAMTTGIVQSRNSSTRVATISNIAGKVKFTTNATDRYTTPNAVAVRTLLWLDIMYDVGTSTTTGKLKACVRNLDGSFALGMTDYVEYTGQNMGGGTMPTELRFGATGTEATVRTVQVERIETVDSYTSAMPTASPPVADAGPDQADVEPYSSVTVSAAASTPGSSAITSTVWTQQSGGAGPVIATPNATSTSILMPAKVAVGVYVFRATVSDGTLSAFDDVQITVLPATKTTWLTDGTEVPIEVTQL